MGGVGYNMAKIWVAGTSPTGASAEESALIIPCSNCRASIFVRDLLWSPLFSYDDIMSYSISPNNLAFTDDL